MRAFKTIFRYFRGLANEVRDIILAGGHGQELISFQCNGCMATDWREVDRGIVVDEVKRVVYGSPDPITYLVVRRTDGSTFECYKPYCHAGTAEMQRYTDNPEESLVGKLVYTN